jgi:hypothetical protein
MYFSDCSETPLSVVPDFFASTTPAALPPTNSR